jgi:outer membrane murein-binding lipoprotein Lpp
VSIRKNKIALIIVVAGTLLAGCASQPKMTASHPLHIDANTIELANIRSMLAAKSLMAQSMSAKGDITLENNDGSNSASFAMKSKRLDANGNRIDSLSIEVIGPFGIKVARFLASPKQYKFYDVLHDQTMSGPTDAKSLEDLTQLKGVSLEMMSDLIYGLAGDDLQTDDSVRLYASSESHYIVIAQNFSSNTTAMLDLNGTLPSDSSAGNLTLVHYRRWNGILDPMENKVPPAVSVRFSEPIMANGVSIPQHIDATAGENKLTLAYDHIDINPPALTVKIKMPSP